nr:ribonuclease H-like domain-containing protein [Tanacetum cinerariifolium]
MMVDLFPLEMVEVEYLEKYNGVVERKNRSLIEAARTMLVDSKSPTTFWAEAVNNAWYVLNRALVIKPHNKTPYELILGRPPLIDFMKPFRCLITILNTKDYLGKFDEKANKGYFVGYSVVIVTGFQANGIAGTKDNIVVGQSKKKKEPEQEYILIPICTTDLLISQGPKDSAVDAGKKATEVHESQFSDNGEQDKQVTRSEFEGPIQQERQTEHINNTNSFNTISSPVNTAGPSLV